MTQEQMAGYLGVTAPAVHKWEKEFPIVKDTTPDITTPRLYIPILRKRVP